MTLDEVVLKDLHLNGYADDDSIWKCFKLKDGSATIAAIELAMQDVKYWIDDVCLKMNESKLELIYFGSKHMLIKCNINTVNINGEHIVRSKKVKYLGGLLDSTLSFHQHVITKCQADNINLQNIRHIRKFLTTDMSAINTITCHVTPWLCQCHAVWNTKNTHKYDAKYTKLSSQNNNRQNKNQK